MAWILVSVPACLAGQPADDDTAPPSGPPGVLVDTVPLPVGDPSCPGGGVRLRTGLDDGRDGGTAGDGVLQDGEIRTDDLLCNGAAGPTDPDTGPATTASDFPPLGPLAGSPGTGWVRAQGGRGTVGEGAAGGTVNVSVTQAHRYGQLVVSKTGAVDTGFSLPTWPEPSYGAQPLYVDTDLDVPELAASAPKEVGQYYTEPGQPGLRRWQGSGPARITGLQIREGATLRLAPGSEGTIDLGIDGDVRIDGTLAFLPTTDGRAGTLNLRAASILVGPTGTIDVSGRDGGPGEDGQGGGLLTLEAASQFASRPVPAAWFALLGTIDTHGGSGVRGAVGGTFNAEAASLGVVKGRVITHGGAARGGGTSGPAPSTTLEVPGGPLLFDAEVDMHGGEGDGTGGSGGSLVVDAAWATVHGTLHARGGNAGACPAASCNGGRGGAFRVFADYGPVTVDVDFEASGGAGNGPAGNGGIGGVVEIDSSNAFILTQPALPRTVLVTGTYDLSGGDGALEGSPGGSFNVRGGSFSETRGLIALAGIERLELDGGAGVVKGGAGGALVMQVQADGAALGQDVGGAYADPDVIARGGTGAQGGFGGRVSMKAEAGAGLVHPDRAIWWAGSADLRGGAGTTTGGSGGQLSLAGSFDVRSEGVVDARGGEGLPGATAAGKGGRGLTSSTGALLTSVLGTVRVGAPLHFGGGPQGRTGGDGGIVTLRALAVEVAELIAVEGGDGTDGGDGGRIFVSSQMQDADLTGGSFDISPGDGPGALGEPGRVYVDGFDVSAQWWSP